MSSKSTPDIYNLNRFITAQENIYEIALNEIKLGKKHSHWMWFIFPQIAGIGESEKSKEFSIHSKEEAHEYLRHPILGKRLKLITKTLFTHKGKPITNVFEFPDNLKLLSSMTLFSKVNNDKNDLYFQVIKTFFDGKYDDKTLEILRNL